ncbi:unnamed protein product [Cuscuta epithymum]|uniref:IBH1-like N-terminal domain-containing protein n=1 Tax=Cuscuta epithymum TaxID=186058 RepID=A0AAV0FYB5_9ASTE|nr:unnamed protein product [Cuscuta epithymum]
MASSPSRITTQFTRNFLRSLQRLNRRHNSADSPPPTRCRRYRKIKLAAYASMASAVGTDRAWSRALLWRIRTRASLHRVPTKSRLKRDGKFRGGRNETNRGWDNTEELRKIVPGGEAMDMCCLLDETAHYIQCLASQVEVMRNIADLFSSSSN